MFTHVVLFKLNNPTKENVESFAGILKAMDGNIPQLISVEVGEDELFSERSYHVSLITKFESLEKMQEYQVHPYHVNEVLKYIKPMIESSITVDYSI